MDALPPYKPRLIIVDDEVDLREMVADYLGQDDWSVRTASSGSSLDALLDEQDADLIVLDINMPGEDGLSILQRIRWTRRTPVVMLTAASNIADKIAGLDMGADDYMTKPFDLRELKTRIKTVLRRVVPADDKMNDSHAIMPPKNVQPFGKMFVDLDARSLLHSNGTREPVTAMEFDLLRVFLHNPNRVLTRDRLLDLAHKHDNEAFDRSIDVRVARLRKKVEHDPSKPEAIKTIRGVGYVYTPAGRTT